mmetsp:Transcript_8619/g.20124  ORF Transcript_8619/g.20124 Transcript_8619/m.20124 type:complete len:263 (-) Transcript_8619:171-959(-)
MWMQARRRSRYCRASCPWRSGARSLRRLGKWRRCWERRLRSWTVSTARLRATRPKRLAALGRRCTQCHMESCRQQKQQTTRRTLHWLAKVTHPMFSMPLITSRLPRREAIDPPRSLRRTRRAHRILLTSLIIGSGARSMSLRARRDGFQDWRRRSTTGGARKSTTSRQYTILCTTPGPLSPTSGETGGGTGPMSSRALVEWITATMTGGFTITQAGATRESLSVRWSIDSDTSCRDCDTVSDVSFGRRRRHPNTHIQTYCES